MVGEITSQQVKVTGLKIQVNSNQACQDIVLCSYRLLYSPVYRRRLLELVGEDVAAKSEAEILRSHAERLGCDLLRVPFY